MLFPNKGISNSDISSEIKQTVKKAAAIFNLLVLNSDLEYKAAKNGSADDKEESAETPNSQLFILNPGSMRYLQNKP